MDGKRLPYKSWPEPAAFLVDEGIQIYCTEFSIMKPGQKMGVPVCHLALTSGEIYYVKFKEEGGVSGEVLQVVGANGQLGWFIVLRTGEAEGCCRKASVWGFFPFTIN